MYSHHLLPDMNVHHLELFYYVGKHGGISEACRKIPYGVQQPAVSTQIGRLEEDLGAKLFERRPFRLTEEGRLVYDFIAPFFGGLEDLEGLVNGRISGLLRIVGLGEVIKEYLPDMIRSLHEADSKLKMTIQELEQTDCEEAIRSGNADIAVSVLPETLPKEFSRTTLLSVPIGLLVHRSSRPHKPEALLRSMAGGAMRLVCLPTHELLTKIFLRGARDRGLKIAASLEVASHETVVIYAKAGLGIGLVAWSPSYASDKTVEFLPLDGFKKIEIGAFWLGEIKPPAKRLVTMLESRVKAFAEKR